MKYPVAQSIVIILASVGLFACGGGSGDADDSDGGWSRSLNPRVVMDTNGNVLAVWQRSDGGPWSVKANSYVVGMGWDKAKFIETYNTKKAHEPLVVMDASGNAMAVWKGDGGRYDTGTNHYVAGVGWGAAGLFDMNNSGVAMREPQVAMSADGDAMMVWREFHTSGSHYDIWANRYEAGIGWGASQLIKIENTKNAYEPQVLMDANGNAMAVWQQYGEGGDSRWNIWTNRYEVGKGWGMAELIETSDAGDAESPQMAVDADGNVVAVWRQNNRVGGPCKIYVNHYVVGVGWGAAMPINTGSIRCPMSPQISVDANGNAMLVWRQTDVRYKNIWASRYEAGIGWGAAELIETNDAGNAGNHQIAVDASGNAVAVWQQYDGTRWNIWANYYKVGVGWGRAGLVEVSNNGNAEYPKVAVDVNGNAVVVWYQGDGVIEKVLANRYVVGIGWGTAELIDTN